MAICKIVVGIDVSKDRLDVFLRGEGSRFEVANAAAGLAELIRRLDGLTVAAIALEASGGYERAAARQLAGAYRERRAGRLRYWLGCCVPRIDSGGLLPADRPTRLVLVGLVVLGVANGLTPYLGLKFRLS